MILWCRWWILMMCLWLLKETWRDQEMVPSRTTTSFALNVQTTKISSPKFVPIELRYAARGNTNMLAGRRMRRNVFMVYGKKWVVALWWQNFNIGFSLNGESVLILIVCRIQIQNWRYFTYPITILRLGLPTYLPRCVCTSLGYIIWFGHHHLSIDDRSSFPSQRGPWREYL